jgi:hypothetical protein
VLDLFFEGKCVCWTLECNVDVGSTKVIVTNVLCHLNGWYLFYFERLNVLLMGNTWVPLTFGAIDIISSFR